MKVGTILKEKNRKVVTTRPNELVKHAADRLRMENIAALVVVEHDAIIGIISDREIVYAFSRHGAELMSMQVKSLMVEPIPCTPDDDIKRIMKLMTQRRVRHLPVLENGKLVGIVSIGDVVRHRLTDLELEAGVMRDAYFAAH